MKSLRPWATPLTIAAFFIMAVTGVMMFFHINTTLGKVLHEYASWLMVIGVAVHLVLNWRPFTTYFKRPVAATVVGAGALLLALSFLPLGPNTSGIEEMDQIAMGAMMGGQIETLAILAGSDTEIVLAQLGAAGFEARASDTPAGLAAGDRMKQAEIVTTIFAQ